MLGQSKRQDLSIDLKHQQQTLIFQHEDAKDTQQLVQTVEIKNIIYFLERIQVDLDLYQTIHVHKIIIIRRITHPTKIISGQIAIKDINDEGGIDSSSMEKSCRGDLVV